MNFIKIGIIAAITIFLLFFFIGCERVDAGHVGVKVKLSGSDKGVQDVTEVTGWCFFNRWVYDVYEFPTFVQHKEYSGEEAFVINSRDGSEFHVSPILNYSVRSEKVVDVFKKYRRPLGEIENGFIKTAVYDAFRMAANKYNADSLISNRESFEQSVRKGLEKQVLAEGFVVNQFTSNLKYPETFKQAIDAKNSAVQKALQIDNEVKQAEAAARKSIVQTEAAAKVRIINAEAYADATLKEARADAEANRLKQQTITPLLINMTMAEKWNGVLPVYGQTPTMFKDISK